MRSRPVALDEIEGNLACLGIAAGSKADHGRHRSEGPSLAIDGAVVLDVADDLSRLGMREEVIVVGCRLCLRVPLILLGVGFPWGMTGVNDEVEIATAMPFNLTDEEAFLRVRSTSSLMMCDVKVLATRSKP